MAQIATRQVFRQSFKTVEKDLLRWFPGHMDKGIKQMQQKLKLVDCIIEVHDARIPISGRNPDFKFTVSGLKPHILVFNKKDLIDNSVQTGITKHVAASENSSVFFTNCKDHADRSIRKILQKAENLIENSERYNRAQANEYNLMVIGVPNVGKSSLINCLRNYHLKKSGASAVGAAPGITRGVLNRIKMCQEPLVYLYDTPGILAPKVSNVEAGLKLALCATLQDHLVGEATIADYLLYWLNKHQKFKYVKLFELNKASDDILQVLLHLAKKSNKTVKVNLQGQYVIQPDLNSAAKAFIKAFRTGDLGKIMLDRDLIPL